MRFEYNKNFSSLPIEINLPENFEETAEEKVCKYFIYNRKMKKGTCSACNSVVQYDVPKNKKDLEREVRFIGGVKKGEFIKCPVCGETLTAYPESFEFFQGVRKLDLWNEGDYICYAITECSFRHRKDDGIKCEPYSLYPIKIGRMSRGLQEHYIFLWGRSWEPTKARTLYDANFNLSLNERLRVRTAIAESFLGTYDVFEGQASIEVSAGNTLRLIGWNVEHPQAEYLQKFGLYELCTDAALGAVNYIRPNWRKATLHEVLRLSPQDVDKLRQWKMLSTRYIPIYQKLKKEKQRIDKSLMETCFRVACTYGCPDEFFLKSKEYFKLSRVCRYILKQYEDNMPGCSQGLYGYSISTVANTWKDYYKMLKARGYPLNDYYLYPKSLTTEHDRLAEEINRVKAAEKAETNAKKQEKFEKQLKKLRKLSYERKNLFIRPLENYKEFADEGKLQQNCVATYFDNAVRGTTAIFTIRDKKEPGKPIATVELKDGRVVQCRGYKNCTVDDEIRKFCSWWETRIVGEEIKKGAA